MSGKSCGRVVRSLSTQIGIHPETECCVAASVSPRACSFQSLTLIERKYQYVFRGTVRVGSCLRLDLSSVDCKTANYVNLCSEVMTYSVGDFLSPLTPCRSTASSDLPLFISITISSLLAFSFVLENENNR